MIEFKEPLFSQKFPNWKIHEITPSKIEITPISIENSDEVTEIISYLYNCIPDTKWSFDIHNTILVAERKPKAKYNRMYTSGCFDIFHYGHLNILIKSKELCDYLIVGVSTDALIESEKGKKPIIPFEERIKVVESIGLVDEVIAQTDKNKQKIVDAYAIDAISVGSDWKGRYPKVSCAMEYFPYTENVSSTILREALKLHSN